MKNAAEKSIRFGDADIVAGEILLIAANPVQFVPSSQVDRTVPCSPEPASPDEAADPSFGLAGHAWFAQLSK